MAGVSKRAKGPGGVKDVGEKLADSEPAFELEPGSGAPKWEEWAALYGSNPRTLKRWAAQGRTAGEACPFEHPERMPHWWNAHMKHQVPRKILEAAEAAEKARAPLVSGVKKIGAAAIEEKAAAPALVLPDFRSATEDEVGIEATLRRLQDSEVFTHQVYKEALSKGDLARASSALKSFTDLAGEVVRVREKALAYQQKTRDLIPRPEAEAAIADLHLELINRLRGMGSTVFRKYSLPETAENLARWTALCDDLCESLQAEVFSDDEE